jgi:hypothetical protein
MNFKNGSDIYTHFKHKTDACLKVIADDFYNLALNLTKNVSSYNLESHIHFE